MTDVRTDAPAAVFPPAWDLPVLVRQVLQATARAAGLLVLQVSETGGAFECTVSASEDLSSRELVVWTARTTPAAGVAQLVLLAVARRADPGRTNAVREAGELVRELLRSSREREQALDAAEQASELAGVDPLTGLGNRRAWRQALDQETARQRRYPSNTTVLVVDLDDLKQVNDSEGHRAGDDHLRRAASALRAAARRVDVVCRLGGDEFAVLAPNTDSRGATVLVDRVRRELEVVQVRASVGACTTDLTDLDLAWQDADARMYDDKRQRRG